MKPECSILIATHNRAEMLPHALESALAQTYKNIEVVVYDDGSTDETSKVPDAYPDERLRYVRSEVNCGVGNARATLMELARAPYACWLDTDDLCNKHRIAMQLPVMKKYEPSFVRTGRTYFGTRARLGADVWKRWPERCRRPESKRFEMVSPSMMFNVERAKGVPYDRRLRCGSDVVWEMQATLEQGPGIFIPIALYHYGRGHRSRVTTRVQNERQPNEFTESLNSKQVCCRHLEAELQRRGIERWPTDLLEDQTEALLAGVPIV